jgi:hypothetical protein
MTPPRQHWRSYGNDPLPTRAEALDQPFAAFPSWLLRMRHDGCGGGTAKVELLTGIEGVNRRPVRVLE